jgi:hypothetical protein
MKRIERIGTDSDSPSARLSAAGGIKNPFQSVQSVSSYVCTIQLIVLIGDEKKWGVDET